VCVSRGRRAETGGVTVMSDQRRSPDTQAPQIAAEEGGTSTPRHTIRLPRFFIHDDAGLGDVVKRATSAAGIRPCAGCEERAARLNRWVGFKPRP
jgi:hypothetical protein